MSEVPLYPPTVLYYPCTRAIIRRLAARFRAKREQLEWVKGLYPESQGQNLALTVLHVLYSLDTAAFRFPPPPRNYIFASATVAL